MLDLPSGSRFMTTTALALSRDAGTGESLVGTNPSDLGVMRWRMRIPSLALCSQQSEELGSPLRAAAAKLGLVTQEGSPLRVASGSTLATRTQHAAGLSPFLFFLLLLLLRLAGEGGLDLSPLAGEAGLLCENLQLAPSVHRPILWNLHGTFERSLGKLVLPRLGLFPLGFSCLNLHSAPFSQLPVFTHAKQYPFGT